MVHPAPNGFIADRDAAFRQQIFDVAQAQGEPEIEPDRLMNDLRWEPISTVADFLHPLGYRPARATASPRRRDNAFGGVPFTGGKAASAPASRGGPAEPT